MKSEKKVMKNRRQEETGKRRGIEKGGRKSWGRKKRMRAEKRK